MMNINEIFRLSFESLSDRKIRSILTILMVMVGSALLIAVGGIGAAFTDAFDKQFRNLAPNILFISSSQQAQGDAGGGIGGAGNPPPAPKITLNAAIENRIHSLPFVSDVISTYRGSVTVQSQSQSKTDSILSMDPQKLLVIAPTLEFTGGSTLQPNNPSSMIVAQNVANPPGDSNPFLVLGQSAKVTYSFVDTTTGQQKQESKNFIVTGIIKETGNPTIDGAIVINLQAGNSLLQKSGKFDSLFVIAQTTNYVDVVEQEIRTLYGNNIGITTVKAILKTIEQFTGQIKAFLSSIAIISLIVGAVGIITTLYTAVIERTREIGTLKAIGAQNSDILALFLVEALLIGIFGATLGLLAGIGLGYGLSATVVPGNGSSPPIYTASDMARVWMISVGLSIVAGVVPALQASRLLPVQALRSQ
jgi:putative ABC transport system permease protein